MVGRVVLVQVVVPSREDVQEYKDLLTEINELVGDINGRFGKSKGLMQVIQSNWSRICRIHAHPLHAQIYRL